ncbi:MAG: ABC transporter ATP-binding protein [Armatimonadetes bacterium]|nr:ABC transporter ATP-binding protein [Armatimonadota bacterium]
MPAPSILSVRDLSKRFPVRGTRSMVHAVDRVGFSLRAGESVGLVGESGCGKSTLVRLVTRLLDPTSGEIRFEGQEIGAIPSAHFAYRPERAKIQMVFQDPTDSLNPRFTAFDTVADPIRHLAGVSERRLLQGRVAEVADLVRLPGELLGRYPHQLSGGQQQRVGIARAIAVSPRLLILDEPTSALDVSVQAVILHLLAELRRRLGMSYLFVSHDLNVVRLITEQVLVMYAGRIVEVGPTAEVFSRPNHPYTRALLSAIPTFDPNAKRERIRLPGEPQSPVDPSPTVCRFFGRCPDGFDRCAREMPALRHLGGDRHVACHLIEGDRAEEVHGE